MNLKQITLCLILFCLTSPPLLYADISTDGTVGAAKTLTGPDYTIPETLGTIKGDNLFHSFEKFSIKTQETATFTGSDSIKNVISRVTGGEKSEIDGTLRSNVGKADFYFVNPSGVVFGENAKVDVPAAFHVSTGNELKFADGSSFKASKSEQSTLTQAAPESFGFLGTQSASIEINGSTLEFKSEGKVSLTSSKDITIKGTETKQASLTGYDGQIELKAKGDLLMDNAIVGIYGNGGRKISVKADNAKIQNNSKISVFNLGDIDSDEGIDFDIIGNLELLNGGAISSKVYPKGYSGSIKINATNMIINGQGNYAYVGIFGDYNNPASEGKAGTVEITVAEYLELINYAQILSNGNSGDVKINAKNMKIDGQENYAGVFNTNSSEGKTGTVEITVAEYLELINGGVIRSSTFSKGDSGDVKINAKNMKIDGQDNYAGVFNRNSSEGKAGTVEITVAEFLELINGGQITSSTVSKGDSGDVKINAKNMKIDAQGNNVYSTGVRSRASQGSEGKAGTVEITLTGYLELLNGGEIVSETVSKGDSGDVKITVSELLEIINGGVISSSTFSEGDAGNIKINACNMKIDRQGSSYFTGVTSSSEETNSEGKAGNVEITVSEYFELINGGSIGCVTFAKGDAGDVRINAKNMKIDGHGSSNYFTGVSSSADPDSEGKAGTVAITVAEYLELINGGQILTSTWSKGDAGDVRINAKNMKIDGHGSSNLTCVSSSAYSNSEGKAGEVIITIAELLEVLNSGQIVSGTFSKGNAGSVKINAKNMKIDGKGGNKFTGVGSTAEPNSEGKAGKVIITIAEFLEVLNSGQIVSGTWSKGDAGGVKINAKNMKIDDQGSSYFTGVASNAEPDSFGNAGTVDIVVTNFLELIDGGAISSNTWSKGDAGDIFVNSDKLIVDASYIQSGSGYSASGYVGNVTINANSVNLINGSEISIGAYQTLSSEKLANMQKDKSITLNTKELTIENQSKITSESTKNVPASDININSDSIYLHDGLITTSVSGTNGDGGDISINEHSDSNSAGMLVMQNGFIQANTSAEGSKGGSIRINPDTLLIADKSMPFQIGGEPETFSLDDKKNIIQAADPSKNPQDIQSPTAPVDIGGSLINSGVGFADSLKKAKDPCQLIGTKKASTLRFGGKGGIPEPIREPGTIYYSGKRLDDLIENCENQ